MNFDFLSQVVGLISGGSFIAIITLIINQMNKKQEVRSKSIDDRIDAWQKIADEHKQRIDQVEKQLDDCCSFSSQLQDYITKLERLLSQKAPDVELPERPILNKDNSTTQDVKPSTNNVPSI